MAVKPVNICLDSKTLYRLDQIAAEQRTSRTYAIRTLILKTPVKNPQIHG